MKSKTIGDKLIDIVIILIMIILAACVMLPMLNIVSLSLTSAQEIATKRTIIIPTNINFDGYRAMLDSGSVLLAGFKVTFLRVIIGTTINLLCSYFVGFALAKPDLPGRTWITFFFFFTMLFGGGLIPTYIVVKSVGLINNFWVYILPGVMSVWNMLLIRNFIMNIPQALFESAQIDGAGNLRVIFQIALPLSVPALATIGLFYAVAHWNAWWDSYLYTSKIELQTAQLVLRDILARANMQVKDSLYALDKIKPPSRAVQNAAVIITTAPILLVYPLLQKYYVKGIITGAVKG